MSEVLRTDLLDHGMNAGKERKVFDLLRAWRACAVVVGREQWRLFFETGRVNKMHRSPVESDLAAVVGAANRLQMVRHQVVGILDSYLANRQNEFSRIVECSSLPAGSRVREAGESGCPSRSGPGVPAPERGAVGKPTGASGNVP
jgi:putative transposase